MKFEQFKIVIQNKIAEMIKGGNLLYLTGVDSDALWQNYLDSFPEGTNPMFRERREYDCSCCRQFIRPYGNLVAINEDGTLTSIWDIKVEGYYQDVADTLSKFVKSKSILDVFITDEKKMGNVSSNTEIIRGESVTWHHFYHKLENYKGMTQRSKSPADMKGDLRTSFQVFQRALEEIDSESIQTVIDLINENELYRGEESKTMVDMFQVLHTEYHALSEELKDNYCWNTLNKSHVAMMRIRSSVIGTLLIDLSEGKEVEYAVASFEAKMAPANYKRPKPVQSKKRIEAAEKTVVELGLLDSLGRRYCRIDDITVNNVIFADRAAQAAMQGNVFDQMKAEVKENVSSLKGATEISIEDFIQNILPEVNGIEALVENRHTNNLMSLIAPVIKDSKSMFKWSNNFSWAYNGDMTDSIKEQVKRRGGKVDGRLRFSIQWDDNCDLDAHCRQPNGFELNFSQMKDQRTGGNLDVDIITPSDHDGDIVENITWPDEKMPDGDYHFAVNNYSLRGESKGFKAEIEFLGKRLLFTYDQPLRNKEMVSVAIINIQNGVMAIKQSLPESDASKNIWGINTQKFHRVSTLLYSPNHWDENNIGNKHFFFILDKCKNDGQPRGFFNEYLLGDLNEHRKVFETLGSKMKVAPSDDQLSGLGFSSTVKTSVFIRTVGDNQKVYKVNF